MVKAVGGQSKLTMFFADRRQAIEHAKKNDNFQDLGRRFHTVLFLATPHREAEDRQLLRSILRACNTSTTKSDALEPDPNSSVVREINDSFYACSQDLRIWSFYETNSDPLVNKRRATLGKYISLSVRRNIIIHCLRLITGLGQEREVRVNADHGGVARFQSSADPTYYSIKEILIGLERDIQEERESIVCSDSLG